MEEMASLWSYQETVDELRQKLLYTNVELEELKADKNDEMKKNKECVKQLIQMLKTVCQERDEAKDQLQKLLNKIDSDPPFVMKSTKANSTSITDQSNSMSSETYNYHNSSPKIDSFFDSVASPECSNNMAYDHNVRSSDSCVKVDKVSLIIENLVKGKTLPQQGKLLQAVVETGPILQTLLVSGQLPQWRNPPHVSIKGCQSDSYLSHPQDSTSLHISQQMLHFANFESGFCLENHSLMSAGKRQRLY